MYALWNVAKHDGLAPEMRNTWWAPPPGGVRNGGKTHAIIESGRRSVNGAKPSAGADYLLHCAVMVVVNRLAENPHRRTAGQGESNRTSNSTVMGRAPSSTTSSSPLVAGSR